MSGVDWLRVEVGDALVRPDGIRRPVLSVKRVQLRGYPPRTSIHVPNLKQPSRTTILMSTDGRCCCYRLEKRAPREWAEDRDHGDEQ